MKNQLKFLGFLSLISLNLSAANAGPNYEQTLDKLYSNKIIEGGQTIDLALKETDGSYNDKLLVKFLLASRIHDDSKKFDVLDLLSKSPENVNPYFYYIYYTDNLHAQYNNERGEKILLQFLERKDLLPSIEALINEALANRYMTQKKFSKADTHLNRLGFVADWKVLGSFENISESGFDKDFGVLANPKPDAKFKNKNNADISWFTFTKSKYENWMHLDNSFVANNSILYAQSFCNSSQDMECQFRIGTSGSLKVWVNDQIAISKSKETNNGLDTYIAKVTLRKGWNRILLQVGSSEVERNNFCLRVTDMAGKIIPDLKFSSEYAEYTKEKSAKFAEIEHELLNSLNSLNGQAADNDIRQLIKSEIMAQTSNLNDAAKINLSLLEKHPKSSMLMGRMYELYHKMNNETGKSLYLQKIRQEDPYSATALLLTYSELLNAEQYDKAKNTLDTLRNFFMDADNIDRMEMKLLSAQQKYEEMFTLIHNMYKRNPNNEFTVGMEYAIATEKDKDFDLASSILEKFTNNNVSFASLSVLAKHYGNIGKLDKQSETIDQMIEYFPNSANSYFEKARICYDKKDYTEAIHYYKQASEIAPDIASPYSNIAQCYKEMGKNDEAKQYFNLALKYDPFSYSSRESLRELDKLPNAFSYFDELDVYKVFADSKSDKTEATDDAHILLDETQTIVYKGGAIKKKNFLVAKILSKDGIDSFKEYYMTQYANQSLNVEKAEVLKANGDRSDAEVEGETAVFTNLEVGDAIALIYTTENQQFGTLSRYYWDNEMQKSFFNIKKKKNSILVIDKDDKITYKWALDDIKPQYKEFDGMRMYAWESNDIKKIKYEDFMPNYMDVANILNISTIGDWEVVSNWYYDIANAKAKSTLETQDAIKAIFPDGKPKDNLKAVKAIYEYIVGNIRYSSIPFRQSGIIPQSASNTLNTKIGDCKDVSTLFIALCREIGVDATWVLVATKDMSKSNLLLPSIDFNHCIATVTIDGKKYYVELTSDLVTFGYITSNLNGALCLEISPNKGNKLQTLDESYSTAVPEVIRNTEVFFDDETMHVTTRTIKGGEYAFGMRSNYKSLSKEEQDESITASLSGAYPHLALKSFTIFSDLEKISDSVSYAYDYNVEDIYTKIANMVVFMPPISDKFETLEFVSSDKREHDLDLSGWPYYGLLNENLHVDIPDKYVLSALPQSTKIENQFGTYTLDFAQKENKLIINRKLKMKQNYIKQADFPEFKKFINKVMKCDSEQIAFSPKTEKQAKKGKKNK